MGVSEAREILAKARRCATFSGAGLSAESGIATFRGSGEDSLWRQYDPQKLASIDGFNEDPDGVLKWYHLRRKALCDAKPNSAHLALASQTEMIHITQNVDDLLERGGVVQENIIHLHGSIMEDRCEHACGLVRHVVLERGGELEYCTTCHGRLRPNVVFFGEYLPEQAFARANEICRQLDCLIVIGTSANVYPAAGLIDIAKRHSAAIIVVNMDVEASLGHADIVLQGKAGEILPELLAGFSLRS